MRIKDIKIALNYLLPKDGSRQYKTPMIYGYPGIGKSSLIQQIAQERNIELIDLRLSQHDNTDFKFPVVGENTVRWITADFMPIEGNPRFKGTQGILFLDEMNLASSDVLASVFQLIYDRRVGDNKILDGWHIVAAGNLGYEDGNDEVVDFPTALRDRIAPYVMDQFNNEEWLDYAVTQNCSSFVIDYIAQNTTKLYVEAKWRENKVFVTPRRWLELGQLMNSVEVTEVLNLLKYTGEAFLYGEVAEFVDYIKDILNSMETVDINDLFIHFHKYEKILADMDRDKIFQMNGRITGWFCNPDTDFIINKVMLENFKKYILGLSDDLKVSFLRGIKHGGIKAFGKEGAEKKPVGKFLTKFFEYDEELSDRISELIKAGIGMTDKK